MKYSYYSFAISRLFQCLFCSPVSVQFTSYRNLKTSSSQVLTGSCSDCRIPAAIRFIDLVSPQYWAQAAEYCNSGQKKDNTAAQVNAQRQPKQKIRVTPEGFLRRQNKEFDRETKTRLGDTGFEDFFAEAAEDWAKPERDMSRITTIAEKYGLHDA